MPLSSSKRSLATSLAAAALLLGSTPAEAATRYVFTVFLGDAVADEKLSVYTSPNGLDFTLLANTNYGGPTGVLRDPTIMKHTDGKYYVAYTVQSWTTNSTTFGIASSTNLTSWTFHTEVPAGVPNASHTWAPEWFIDDDGIHLIVNIDTTSAAFSSYVFKAKDDTLTDWEAPVHMGIGPNNIDTVVVRDGATFHAFSKNETTKFIEHATASALLGPWTWVGTGDWAGWGSGKEGISLFRLDSGTWRMFLDCYSGCGFLYADSDDLNEWSDTRTVPGGLSGVVRHGTVLREETGTGGLGGAGAGGRGGTAGATSGGGNAGRSAGGANATGGMNATGGVNATGGAAGSAMNGGRDGTSGATSSAGRGVNATGGANNAGGVGGASAGRSATGDAGTMSGSVAGSTSTPSGATTPDESSGCGCRAPRSDTRAAWPLALALALLGARRRARRDPVSRA